MKFKTLCRMQRDTMVKDTYSGDIMTVDDCDSWFYCKTGYDIANISKALGCVMEQSNFIIYI